MNDIRIETGASSYFSKPSNILDPTLFEGEHLYSDVRKTLLDTFYGYMAIKYINPELWTMVWLAGSGISYQWSANRGNGDLDVLFGLDYSEFVNHNPQFQWMDRHEIAEHITRDLRKNLWPSTAHMYLPGGMMIGKEFEVTFFLNDNVGSAADSIVNIQPYAAYNLTNDEWTVKPPGLPADPHVLYPSEYYGQAEANRAAAKAIVSRYNHLRSQGQMVYPGSPQDINLKKSLGFVKTEARNLFDSLHLGRHMAFSSQGEGYGDFYNFAWQQAKADGVINALNEIINKEH